MEWMIMPIKRYADFNGRSCRQEYWMFTLFQILVTLVFVGLIVAILGATGGFEANSEPPALFWVVFGLGLLAFLGLFLVPSIAVTVRRFHDQDKSGWMYLLSFIPYVGGIVVFVFMCLKGTDGPNQYGDDPLNPNRLGDIFA